MNGRKILIASFLQYALIGPDAPIRQYPRCVTDAWRTGRKHKAKAGDATKGLPEITRGRISLADAAEILKIVALPEFGDREWTLRNKGLFAFLWDSGARMTEALEARLCDLRIEGDHGSVTLAGKTGTRRDIPLAWSIPYLKPWVATHPFRNNPETPLFVTADGTRLHRSALNTKFARAKKMLAERGHKLEPKTSIHSFRHGRCQHAKTKEKLSDEQLRRFFGWRPGSAMPSRYGGAASVTEAIHTYWGIETGTEKEKGQLPRVLCGSCGVDAPPGAHFCPYCAAPLDQRGAERAADGADQKQRLARLEADLTDLRGFLINLGMQTGLMRDSTGELRLTAQLPLRTRDESVKPTQAKRGVGRHG